MTVSGTPTSTSSVSLRLVSASITSPPTSSSRLRTASDAGLPITVSSIVVSLVSREITSPVRVTSNQPGGSVEQVVEHRAAQVGRHALAEPRHVVEARVGRDRHHDDDDERPGERPVELAGVAGDEAAVDDELDALPQRQHRRRRDDQRDRGDDERQR